MSYDTTVNEALDPPEARIAARSNSARRWIMFVAGLTTVIAGLAVVAWIWLR
jgi:hypothetical protein